MILWKYLPFLIYLLRYTSTQDLKESEAAEQLYKKLFRRQRADQLEAIKNFRKLSNFEKQYSMVMLMAEKVFTVIQESRAILESSSFIPGVSEFPVDNIVRDSLSNVLENTALFSDIVLRFPDIAVSVLKTDNNWDIVLQWSIAFCQQMNYLLDNSTIKLLNLVSQELNHVEQDPNYVNPYKSVKKAIIPEERKPIKKKKKHIKKGPRLTHFEL